jgi:hypothetical protein
VLVLYGVVKELCQNGDRTKPGCALFTPVSPIIARDTRLTCHPAVCVPTSQAAAPAVPRP